MIKLNLIGGLGNQMFEYAFARALSEEFNDEKIVINDYFDRYVNLYANRKFKSAPIDLKYLYLNENVKYAKHSILNILSSTIEFIDFAYFHQDLFRQKFTAEIYEKRSARGKYQQAKGLQFTYYPHSKTAPQRKLVTDSFQSEKYFKHVEGILRKEFKVKIPPSPENEAMIKEVSSVNSVAVHIRRGDYNDEHWSFFNVCNEDYYQRAMNYVEEHTENPVFYIFSNNFAELEWIKNNYHFSYSVKYVNMKNPAYEDYRLMYNCKHFVMSNSTFSWWGSYMSENPNKIVVAPDIWLKKEYIIGSMDIYRDDMIKIPVEMENFNQ